MLHFNAMKLDTQNCLNGYPGSLKIFMSITRWHLTHSLWTRCIKLETRRYFTRKKLISTSRNSCEHFASSVTISIGSYRFVLIGRVRSISRELDFANKLSLSPTYPRIQRDLSHQVHTDFAYPQQFLWRKVPWTLSWPFTSVLIMKLRMPGVLPPLSLWVTPMTWLGTLCYPSISFINLLTKGDKTRVFAIQNGPFQLTG